MTRGRVKFIHLHMRDVWPLRCVRNACSICISNLVKHIISLRLMNISFRYNISTGDYDGWDSSVNSSVNGIKLDVGEKYGMNKTVAAQRGYVYKQNPIVKLFPSFDLKLRLAINTNQYGRVFQDRWVHTSRQISPQNNDSRRDNAGGCQVFRIGGGQYFFRRRGKV